MTTTQQLTVAAMENQAFALMSRLHVILRRENGRVIDIEFMRIDPNYCRHVLSLAGALENDDLQQICIRLDDIYFGAAGLFVLKQKAPLLARKVATEAGAEAEPAPAPVIAKKAAVRSYIGHLR